MKKLPIKRSKLIFDNTHPEYIPKALNSPLRARGNSLLYYFNIILGSCGVTPSFDLEVLTIEPFLGWNHSPPPQRFLWKEFFNPYGVPASLSTDARIQKCTKSLHAEEALAALLEIRTSLEAEGDFVQCIPSCLLTYNPVTCHYHYQHEERLFEKIEERLQEAAMIEERDTIYFISENPLILNFVESIRSKFSQLHIVKTEEIRIERIEEEKLEISPSPEKRQDFLDSEEDSKVA